MQRHDDDDSLRRRWRLWRTGWVIIWDSRGSSAAGLTGTQRYRVRRFSKSSEIMCLADFHFCPSVILPANSRASNCCRFRDVIYPFATCGRVSAVRESSFESSTFTSSSPSKRLKKLLKYIFNTRIFYIVQWLMSIIASTCSLKFTYDLNIKKYFKYHTALTERIVRNWII